MVAGYLLRSHLKWAIETPATPFLVLGVFWTAVTLWHPRVPSVAWSEYPSGAAPFYTVAHCVSRSAAGSVLRRLGKQSKLIMAHHLGMFALLNSIFVLCGLVAAADVSSPFYIFKSKWLWPLYAVAGIWAPVALAKALDEKKTDVVRLIRAKRLRKPAAVQQDRP